MSAREDKGGVIQPRATAEIESETDALEALRFAKGKASLRKLPVTAEDADAPEVFLAESNPNRRESMDAVARRLAMKVEFMALAKLAQTMPAQRPMMPPPVPGRLPARASPRELLPDNGNVADSFITVPPTVASVPPPDIPPAPRVPSIPDVAPDRTLGLALVTPGFAAAIAASRDAALRGGAWAVLLSMVAIALPAGLLLGQALIPHPASARSAHPAAMALTPAREADAVPTTTVDSTDPPGEISSGTPTGTSTPNANTAWGPVDPQVAICKLHPTHHAKGKSSSKPFPSPAASSAERAPSPAATTNDPSATYGVGTGSSATPP